MKFVAYTTTLFLPALLLAGPPMLTNDPFVPDYGQTELNLAFRTIDRTHNAARIPVIDYNYGIYPNVQLTLEASYIYTTQKRDFDAFTLACKWLFYQNSFFSIATNTEFSSYPIASVFNQGNVAELALPMNITLTSTIDLVVTPTFIYEPDDVSHVELGTYLAYTNNKTTLFSEVFIERPTHNDLFYLINFGFSYQFSDNKAFIFSLGREIKTEHYSPAKISYSGLQITF